MRSWRNVGKAAKDFVSGLGSGITRGSRSAASHMSRTSTRALEKATKLAQQKAQQRKARQRTPAHRQSKQKTAFHPTSHGVNRRPQGNRTSRYPMQALGLPDFTYDPHPDGIPDPGEVVWAWIPYEDDPTIGKDRPVLVLARHKDWLVVAQMTSQDHDTDDNHQGPSGRYWYDVGTGAWDKRRRRSEVRIDRLLQVKADDVRREGASINRETFYHVRDAIIDIHRQN